MKKIEQVQEFFMSSWAIDKRVTTYVLTFLVTLVGIMSFNSLPKENFPEIAIPMIYIGTPYPGNSPENIEKNISYHIEKELKSIKGVKKIKSQSIQDFSIVIVEFETNVDIPEAKKEVKDAVDRAKSNLPNDLDADPLVQDINLSEIPIMYINVSADVPAETLKRYAEDLQDEIETLSEIRRVDLLGLQDKEIQIDLDLFKMQANDITFDDVSNAIRQRDVLISGGNVEIGTKEYTLQIAGKFSEVNQIGEVILRNSRGLPVYLKDIASIRLAAKDPDSYSRLDGIPTTSLNVIKKAGENLVDAADKITVLVDEFQKTRIPAELRDKFKIKISADQSFQTKNMLNELTNTIVIGFILVTLVLMFFMGIRDSMFVGLSVPLSSLIAFAVLPWLGFTLNLVVLFTFIFALGIVVDNAIVIVENTHRIYNEDKKISISKAAKIAAGEVILPVFAGTLTTMAPFLPLAFWEGVIGEFMFFLPITIIITLAASLLVAYVINPVFAVTFMKREEEEKRTSLKGFLIILGFMAIVSLMLHLSKSPVGGNIFLIAAMLFALNRFILNPMIRGFQNKILPWLLRIYRETLRWSLKGWHPYFVLAATFGMLIFSFMFFAARPPKVVFFPEAEPNFMYIYTQLPVGTGIKKTNEVTLELEEIVYDVLGKDNPVVKSVITNVAKGAGSPDDFNQSSIFPNKSRIQVEFVPFKERGGVSTAKILENVREKMKNVAGAVITVEKEANGPPTAKPVNIEVKGDNFAEIIEKADLLRNYLDSLVNVAQKKGYGNLRGVEELKWDIEAGKPEMSVQVDYTKASELGMNVAQVGLAFRTAVFGREVSKYRIGEDEYPIMVRLDDKYRDDIDALQDMNISYRDMSTGSFHSVPIRSIATLRDTSSFGGINRLDLKQVVTISSNVLTDFNPNEVVAEVTKWMDTWKSENAAILGDVSVEMTGETKEQEETGRFLAGALMTSGLLIFLILIFQFNSIPRVMIIFSQIFLSIVGVLIGFAATQMDMSIVMVGVGVVSLAGIVVNNGIILIDFFRMMMERGHKTRAAIIEGGATRFIPVILTAGSTVIGLLPLALAMNVNFGTLFTNLNPHLFFGGDTAIFWGPLSWTIIFGLSFATIVTLVVVPVMFYLMHTTMLVQGRRLRRWREKLGKLIS